MLRGFILSLCTREQMIRYYVGMGQPVKEGEELYIYYGPDEDLWCGLPACLPACLAIPGLHANTNNTTVVHDYPCVTGVDEVRFKLQLPGLESFLEPEFIHFRGSFFLEPDLKSLL